MHLAGKFRTWTRWSTLSAVFVAGACAHPEPFNGEHAPEQGPFNPAPPVRLTLNPLEDRYAAWMPDGSGLIYTYGAAGPLQRDRCLAELPAGGGQIRRSRCPDNDFAGDSVDVYIRASPSNRSEIAWMEHHSQGARIVPDYGFLVVGTMSRSDPVTRLLRFPYLAPNGRVHASAIDLRWVSRDEILYIGVDLSVVNGDTLLSPEGVMLVDRRGGAPVLLPGTAGITSISPVEEGGGFYFTRLFDSHVYLRFSLMDSTSIVIHPFAEVAHDAAVSGTRLVATVGTGDLAIVDLTNGGTTRIAIPGWRFQRPALSPDGRTVVVEGIDPDVGSPDLYQFALE